MSLASDLAPLVVLDPEGGETPLGHLWRDRPVILVFIRQFG